MKLAASGVRVVAHAALLIVPLVALGRTAELVRGPALACIALMLFLGEVEGAARTAPDPTRARAPGARLALVSALGLLTTTWAAAGFPSIDTSSSARAWPWLGAPLVLAGIALRAAAMRALGPYFTSEIVAPPGHPLVTSGIYAHLRHPSDVGLVLIASGLSLLASSLPAALITLLTVIPSVTLRIIAEDRALSARHPEAHPLYRRSVPL